MREVVKLFFVCVLLLPVVAYADMQTIQTVQVSYSTGGTAQYNAGTGALNWTQGGGSYIYTMEGGYFEFDNTVLSFDWSLYSDDSAGGTAQAKFSLATPWTVNLYSSDYGSNPVVTLSGHTDGGPFGGKYWEKETGYEALAGKAWTVIDSVSTDETWATDWLGAGNSLAWDGDGIAGLISNLTLNPGTGDIANYASSYTATNGLTITLFADQSQVIPEPATIALLGLGGLAILRRKPRA